MGYGIAWSTPRDWATLEVLTSANMDTYVSSNLLYLYYRYPAIYATNTLISFGTGSVVLINFEDPIYDPNSVVTIGASWKYTTPSTGVYLVISHILFEGKSTWVNAEAAYLAVFKNNSLARYLDYKDSYSGGATQYMSLSGSTFIECTGGDYLDIRSAQASGGTITLEGTAAHNHVSIMKVF